MSHYTIKNKESTDFKDEVDESSKLKYIMWCDISLAQITANKPIILKINWRFFQRWNHGI